MSKDQGNAPGQDDVAQFSGAMDELVSKYDQIINEFTDILDKQTKKIFADPKLEDKE